MKHALILPAVLLLFCASVPAQDDAPKPPPTREEAAAERAFGYLKSKVGSVMTMEKIFAGFAFMADGSTPTEGRFSAELNTCLGGIMSTINGDWREAWYWAYGGLLLAEVHRRWPDDKYKDRLEFILKKIVTNQADTGGWAHKKGFTYGKRILDVAMIGSVTTSALLVMQEAGIEVPEETLKRALAYCDKMSDGGGGMAYGTGNGVGDPCASRGAGLFFGLHVSGRKSALYPKIKEGVRKRVAGIERGHSFPPIHYFNCAVANYWCGSYQTFKDKWLDRLIGLQQGDGSLYMKGTESIRYEQTRLNNPVISTSVLATILVMEKGNLFKKPEKSKKKRNGRLGKN
ncbi:MAG: hypothetical protein ACYTAF_17200, partial [Planctomycetota bacterium]